MVKKGNKLSLILFFSLILTIGCSIFFNAEDVHAASYPFKCHTIRGGLDASTQYTIKKMTGLYQHSGVSFVMKGTAGLKKLSNSDPRAKLAYHYGYKKKWISGVNGCKLSRAFYYAWSGKAYLFKGKVLKEMIDTANEDKVPVYFKVYKCTPAEKKAKSFICWKMSKPAYVIVKKSSTDKSTLSDSYYTLKDIKVGLYKKNKKTLADTLTCNAKGVTKKSKALAAGTYYVKDLSVPAKCGYVRNTKWYKVSVKAGKTVYPKTKPIRNKPRQTQFKLALSLSADSEAGTVSGFNFVLNNNSTGKVTKLITSDSGSVSIKGLKAGKYTLSEKLTAVQQAQQYISVSKPQEITITPAKTATVKWTNKRELDIAQKAVDIAISHVGTINYIQSGKKDWKNLDCGAMVQFAYKEAGFELGKIGTDRIKRGDEPFKAVKNEGDYGLKNAKPGDIIMRATGDFYNTTKYAHVGLYAGNYQIVEVVESGQLRIASLKSESRWGKNGKYIKIFRVI